MNQKLSTVVLWHYLVDKKNWQFSLEICNFSMVFPSNFSEVLVGTQLTVIKYFTTFFSMTVFMFFFQRWTKLCRARHRRGRRQKNQRGKFHRQGRRSWRQFRWRSPGDSRQVSFSRLREDRRGKEGVRKPLSGPVRPLEQLVRFRVPEGVLLRPAMRGPVSAQRMGSGECRPPGRVKANGRFVWWKSRWWKPCWW